MGQHLFVLRGHLQLSAAWKEEKIKLPTPTPTICHANVQKRSGKKGFYSQMCAAKKEQKKEDNLRLQSPT